MRASGVAVFSLVSLVCAGALGKPPAYTLANVGFSTALHPADRCEGEACKDVVSVLEGESGHEEGRVKIVIREHKKISRSRDALLELAREVVDTTPDAVTIRVVSGRVEGRPAVESFSVEGGCDGALVGRIFLALETKTIEIVAEGPVANGAVVPEVTSRIDRLLRGVRIHRLGDASLDPATKRVTPREVGRRLAKSCPSPKK